MFGHSETPDQACMDEQWVQQTLQGKTTGFENLVGRYSARLLRFVYGRVRSMQDAEDICQDTFLKAYQSLHTFDLRSSFKTWLFSIAYHEMVSFLRKKKIPTCSHLPETVDPKQPQKKSLFSWDEIWSAAAQCLPPDQYVLLWLRYKEDMPISEIAQISGKSRLYTRVLLHRARRQLADTLRPFPNEPHIGTNHPAEVSCSMQGESHVL